MAESPVSLHQGGGTLAQAVLASAPEGMLIAPIWKRIAAFMLDVMLISIVLTFLTNGQLTLNLLNFELLTGGAEYILFFSSNWAILLTSHWLYWKYTGRVYGAPWVKEHSGLLSFMIMELHLNSIIGDRGQLEN